MSNENSSSTTGTNSERLFDRLVREGIIVVSGNKEHMRSDWFENGVWVERKYRWDDTDWDLTRRENVFADTIVWKMQKLFRNQNS